MTRDEENAENARLADEKAKRTEKFIADNPQLTTKFILEHMGLQHAHAEHMAALAEADQGEKPHTDKPARNVYENQRRDM